MAESGDRGGSVNRTLSGREVTVRKVSGRKKVGDHEGPQDNLSFLGLWSGTSDTYGVQTRGSPVEDGT
jgi:hypothetical protein